MTAARDTATRVAARGPASHTGRRVVLAALCATQITSWGVLYYAFPVLAGDITAATGWSMPVITGALSISQLIAALVGIPVGRRLDRRGPRGVMTAGSLLGVPAVVLVATAQNLAWFYLAWALAGAAMGAVLYPPAFAALTRWYGPDPVTTPPHAPVNDDGRYRARDPRRATRPAPHVHRHRR